MNLFFFFLYYFLSLFFGLDLSLSSFHSTHWNSYTYVCNLCTCKRLHKCLYRNVVDVLIANSLGMCILFIVVDWIKMTKYCSQVIFVIHGSPIITNLHILMCFALSDWTLFIRLPFISPIVFLIHRILFYFVVLCVSIQNDKMQLVNIFPKNKNKNKSVFHRILIGIGISAHSSAFPTNVHCAQLHRLESHRNRPNGNILSKSTLQNGLIWMLCNQRFDY